MKDLNVLAREWADAEIALEQAEEAVAVALVRRDAEQVLLDGAKAAFDEAVEAQRQAERVAARQPADPLVIFPGGRVPSEEPGGEGPSADDGADDGGDEEGGEGDPGGDHAEHGDARTNLA